MAKHQMIWTEEYKIPSYLVNLRGQAGLFATLNLLQDAGWMHARHMNIRLAPHHGFVFTRQKLQMHEWPKWHDVVTIRTWIRPPMKSFSFRDYEIFNGDKKLGEATASFMVIDLEARKPVQMDWSQTEHFWRADHLLTLNPEKIVLSGEGKECARFQVRNSDLDSNNHVNNTKYAQWILDSLPIEILKEGAVLHDYEVNFLAEAKLSDEIIIRQFGPAPGLDTLHFQGLRVADGKPIFTALFRYKE